MGVNEEGKKVKRLHCQANIGAPFTTNIPFYWIIATHGLTYNLTKYEKVPRSLGCYSLVSSYYTFHKYELSHTNVTCKTAFGLLRHQTREIHNSKQR